MQQAVSTIICEGDAIGAVILYDKEEKEKDGGIPRANWRALRQDFRKADGTVGQAASGQV